MASLRRRHTAYVALGSNLGLNLVSGLGSDLGSGAGAGAGPGGPAAAVRAAVAAVGQDLGEDGELVASSSLYETEPVGVADEAAGQPLFVNAVVCLRSEYGPDALMAGLLAIEQRFGRVRGVRNGPRTLDLDLLLVDDVVLSTAALTLPHPRMHARRFVLEPLVELAPELRHPVLGQTMAALLASLPDVGEQARSGVRRMKEAIAC